MQIANFQAYTQAYQKLSCLLSQAVGLDKTQAISKVSGKTADVRACLKLCCLHVLMLFSHVATHNGDSTVKGFRLQVYTLIRDGN